MGIGKHTSDLMLMLRLNSGHLSPSEEAALRSRIRDDAALREKWRLLRRVLVQGPTANESESAASTLQYESPINGRHRWPDTLTLDPESIAAFAEGSLDDDSAQRLETRFWKSPELLHEVAEAFQFRCEPPSDRQVHSQLTQNLMSLFDQASMTRSHETIVPSDAEVTGLDKLARTGLNGHRRSAEDSATPSEEVEAPPIAELPADQPIKIRRTGAIASPSRAAKRFRRIRKHALWIAPITMIVLALAAWAWSHQLRFDSLVDQDREDRATESQRNGHDVRDPDRHNDDGQPNSNDSGDNDAIVEQSNGSNDADDQEEIDEDGSTGNLVERLPRFPPSSTDGIVRDVDGTAGNEADAIDLESESDPDTRGESLAFLAENEILPLEWERIEGLLAVRDDISGTWTGGSFQRELSRPSTWTTLTGSWAQSVGGEFGQIVLDNNTGTELRRRRIGDRDGLSVRVDHGQVGFLDVPADTRVVTFGSRFRKSLRVVDDNSQFAIVVTPAKQFLLVRRGRVRVGDITLSRGQQANLDQSPARPSDIALETDWMDRPQVSFDAPRRIVQGLLESADLKRDLRELQDSNNSTIQRAGVFWTASLEPFESFFDLMHSDEIEVRQAAFEWLLSQPTQSEILRQALSSLARRSGDPTTIRSLHKWMIMARNGAVLPRNDAIAMIRSLNHGDLAIRQISACLLEMAFGNPVRFDPGGDELQRRDLAERWATQIRGFYENRRTTPAERLRNGNSTRRNERPSAANR